MELLLLTFSCTTLIILFIAGALAGINRDQYGLDLGPDHVPGRDRVPDPDHGLGPDLVHAMC